MQYNWYNSNQLLPMLHLGEILQTIFQGALVVFGRIAFYKSFAIPLPSQSWFNGWLYAGGVT